MFEDLWRGSANAWECDENAHLNVQFWIAFADEAFRNLAEQLGYPGPLIPRTHHVRYLKEAMAGDPLCAVGAPLDADAHGLHAWIELRHVPSGAPAAVITGRYALGDGDEAPAIAVDAARAACAPRPDYGAPRGLPDGEARRTATREEARRLGLHLYGRRRMPPALVRADGRAAAHAAVALISDSINHLFARASGAFDARGRSGVGGVALEHRFAYRSRPAADAATETWMAPIDVGPKIIRSGMWLIEGATGDAWATAESVSAFFDLEARRVIPPSASVADALRAMSVPEDLC